jgi:hypothetical protein
VANLRELPKDIEAKRKSVTVPKELLTRLEKEQEKTPSPERNIPRPASISKTNYLPIPARSEARSLHGGFSINLEECMLEKQQSENQPNINEDNPIEVTQPDEDEDISE